MPEPRPDAIDRTAREALGFEALRPGQSEAIAALLLERPAVVFSPLIALQQDQVESIDENLPGEAAPLNSRRRTETPSRSPCSPRHSDA